MCGTRSKAGYLVLVFLCLLSLATCWAEEYPGEPLAPGWYPISEAELTQLETLQQRQETRLAELQSLSMAHESTIERLETSFAEYVSADQVRDRQTIAISGGIGLLVGIVVAILAMR